MNHTPQPPHDEAEEREWLMQERAAEASRLGSVPDDATPTPYGVIVRTLRQPLDENLPADFACHVAEHARRRASINMYFELVSSWILCGILMVIMTGLLIHFGTDWLKPIQSVLPLHAMANEWVAALVACLLVFNLINKLLDARMRTVH